jgi:hypothetical protein
LRWCLAGAFGVGQKGERRRVYCDWANTLFRGKRESDGMSATVPVAPNCVTVLHFNNHQLHLNGGRTLRIMAASQLKSFIEQIDKLGGSDTSCLRMAFDFYATST